MDDKKRWLLLAIAEIVSTVLGGGCLPYVIMGAIHGFDIFNAVIFVIIAVLLVACQCFIDPNNARSLVLSGALRWGVASCIIMSGWIIAFLAVGKDISVLEYIILTSTISLYMGLFLKKMFLQKKKRRGRRNRTLISLRNKET